VLSALLALMAEGKTTSMANIAARAQVSKRVCGSTLRNLLRGKAIAITGSCKVPKRPRPAAVYGLPDQVPSTSNDEPVGVQAMLSLWR
jgi:hypothetical protein